ncbi:CocE/NonD family hydrolase [soil metagenome]
MKIVSHFPQPVKVVEHLFIPLGDGTRLAAKIWLPEDAEENPVPAIFEYIPYRKRDGTRAYDQGMHMYFAGHGYACLRVDIRGCGDSEGLISDEYTAREQRDGVELIAWIAAQRWCSGSAGIMGISWGGFNALQIAALQPPALKALITVGSTDDRYVTDIHWIGGCLSKDNSDWSATMTAINAMPPDPETAGENWREMWLKRLENDRPWLLTWLAHQRRDAYWQHGSVCEDFSRIKIPVYVVNGWADNYASAIPRMLESLAGPRRGLIGPWAHSYPHEGAPGPAIGWLQEALRWWDHWLKGKQTGIMDEPLLRVWMQESVPPQTYYPERAGRWVSEDAWPSPSIDWRILHPRASGTLQANASDDAALKICSPLWVGAAAGEIGRYGEGAEWPGDQREDDAGSLVFTSAPLDERTEILGFPELELEFASDRSQALVCVRLNDVAPDGRSTRVTYGLLNLTHRESHAEPQALIPGEWTCATVILDAVAHAFLPGHRIAVSISTVYWPIAWPSPELVTLTVFTSGTALRLPHRPPRDEKLRAFGEPEMAPDTPHEWTIRDPDLAASVHRNLYSGRTTVTFPRRNRRVALQDIGHTITSRGLSTYAITGDDPLSAEVFSEFDVMLERKDGTYRHQSTLRLTCDAQSFRIRASASMYENGTEIYAREWDETIPRDMM